MYFRHCVEGEKPVLAGRDAAGGQQTCAGEEVLTLTSCPRHTPQLPPATPDTTKAQNYKTSRTSLLFFGR